MSTTIKHPELPFSVSPTHVIQANGDKNPVDATPYLLAAVFVKLAKIAEELDELTKLKSQAKESATKSAKQQQQLP